jgi:iron complex transport system substrate-binding protein
MKQHPIPITPLDHLWRVSSLLSLLLLVIAFAAGCGSTSKEAQPAAAKEPTKTETAQSTPAPAAAKSAASTEKRVIKHMAGETTIVGTPQKIAVLDYRLADSLLAVGVKPYASTTYLGTINLPYLDSKQLEGTIPLGDTTNLEALLQAAPDLIIGRTPDTKVYEQLSKIAPTILIDVESNSWRKNFTDVAGFIQKDKEAEKWIADYEKKAADIRAQLASIVKPGETFMYIRVMPKEIRVHNISDLFGGTLIQDLKLTPAPGLELVKRVEAISLEKLPDYNADHIFIEVGAPTNGGDKDAEANLNTISQSSIWKNLKAVKNNHVYTMPQWIISDFPHIKLKSLDLILDSLKKAPSTP